MNHPFIGNWTYRSFHNLPDPNATPEALKFAVADLKLADAGFGVLKGRLSFGADYLVLNGSCYFGSPFSLRMQGIGGTELTKGWIYDYQGYLAPTWPNGIAPTAAIVGTLVRTVKHEPNRPAGYVASFIAVRAPDYA